MDENKVNIDWKRLGITLGIVLVTAAVVGGTVWYLMDVEAKSVADTNKETISALQEPIEKSNNPFAPTVSSDSSTSGNLNLGDREMLVALTVKRFDNPRYIPAVNIHKLESVWAVTNPVPLMLTESGYEVPGMGGSSYYWQKTNGVWAFIGSGGEGGFDEGVKAKFSEIPYSIIAEVDRQPAP